MTPATVLYATAGDLINVELSVESRVIRYLLAASHWSCHWISVISLDINCLALGFGTDISILVCRWGYGSPKSVHIRKSFRWCSLLQGSPAQTRRQFHVELRVTGSSSERGLQQCCRVKHCLHGPSFARDVKL